MVMENPMPESLQERVELHNKSIDKECIRQCTPGVALDKRHEKSKADKHHHIDILEHGVILLVEVSVVMALYPHKDPVQDHNDDLNHSHEHHEPEPVFLMSLFSILRHINKFMMVKV